MSIQKILLGCGGWRDYNFFEERVLQRLHRELAVGIGKCLGQDFVLYSSSQGEIMDKTHDKMLEGKEDINDILASVKREGALLDIQILNDEKVNEKKKEFNDFYVYYEPISK